MIERIRYEWRWWKWFFQSPALHTGPGRTDKRTHDILFARWEAQEPDYRGTYPHRRAQHE